MTNKEFFSKRFRGAYEEKWRNTDGKKKTQEEFARAISDRSFLNGKALKVHVSSVQKWLKGEQLPEDKTIRLICEVLKLPKDYFELSSMEDFYEFDKEHQNELSDRNLQRARNMGINIDFIKGLKELVPFDEEFPIYAPISLVGTPPESDSLSEYIGNFFGGKGLKYQRGRNANACPTEGKNSLFQVHKGEETYSLSKADLQYLKELQDSVSDFIRYKFYERAREMDREVEEANNLTVSYDTTGREIHSQLTAKQLQKIDKYSKYLDKPDEEKKEE